MAIPVANFTYLIQGVTVDFTDLSTENPTSWSWDFGGDGTSTDQNPQHIFTAEGEARLLEIAGKVHKAGFPKVAKSIVNAAS